MNELILDGSLIATAFAFSFFFVCLRFLCYFLFLKKVGSPSPINPNLLIIRGDMHGATGTDFQNCVLHASDNYSRLNTREVAL